MSVIESNSLGVNDGTAIAVVTVAYKDRLTAQFAADVLGGTVEESHGSWALTLKGNDAAEYLDVFCRKEEDVTWRPMIDVSG